MENLKIIAISDTFLKKSTEMASDLDDSQKSKVEVGKSYGVKTLEEVPRSAHAKVVLDFGAGEWYIYTPHWDFKYEVVYNTPENINWRDMSQKISKYFTVGEFLRYDQARVPTNLETQRNILKIAQELDKVREGWGSPIIITSGFRPPSVNARVGGVRNSRHIVGDAVDIAPQGKHNIQYFQSWIDQRWFGALGWGASKGFVHLDMRNGKGYQTGGQKGPRWNY